jgi:hypothetical protein
MILVAFVLIIPYIALYRERFNSRPTPHQASRPNKFDDEDVEDDGSETEGSLFGWEEEATLLSDLMEEE